MFNCQTTLGSVYMSNEPSIFNRLTSHQLDIGFNAFDTSIAHALADLSVSKNCQTIFKIVLKPISSGTAVCTLIIEILILNYTINVAILFVVCEFKAF